MTEGEFLVDMMDSGTVKVDAKELRKVLLKRNALKIEVIELNKKLDEFARKLVLLQSALNAKTVQLEQQVYLNKARDIHVTLKG